MNVIRQTLFSRGLHTTRGKLMSSRKGVVHPGYAKNRAIQERFQVDDGQPVHLKGGVMDRILYYSTVAGCGLGLLMCGEYYYEASFPKKP